MSEPKWATIDIDEGFFVKMLHLPVGTRIHQMRWDDMGRALRFTVSSEHVPGGPTQAESVSITPIFTATYAAMGEMSEVWLTGFLMPDGSTKPFVAGAQ